MKGDEPPPRVRTSMPSFPLVLLKKYSYDCRVRRANALARFTTRFGRWTCPSGGVTRVVVVGGGCSGTLVAAELVAVSRDHPCEVVVVDPGETPGRGVAYSTECPSHLLNVSAEQMSAHMGRPAHFATWAHQRDARLSDRGFAPRMLYGDYLEAVWCDAKLGARSGSSLSHCRSRAVSALPSIPATTLAWRRSNAAARTRSTSDPRSRLAGRNCRDALPRASGSWISEPGIASPRPTSTARSTSRPETPSRPTWAGCSPPARRSRSSVSLPRRWPARSERWLESALTARSLRQPGVSTHGDGLPRLGATAWSPSPTSPPLAPPARQRWCSTSEVTRSGTRATCPGRTTVQSGSCTSGSRRSRRGQTARRFGCIAPPAFAPR